ncbi:Glycosyl transferase, group 1 [Rubellimicrobium mesophilum DSM 19309]|uniref:Glycosyl transferase, group 1 n=1 Tax=Rubellimicrobium mesophilum DSM 19309 TaxID=442562 RepID=A0A017HL92_9RHOB|nr:glycosyltransferase [Rubellimicrobium mesophilum]EYD75070.1 Glycosyl transferase, group 1 [Rubellimicrobium mesophilum DSM 19309]
MKVDIIIAGFGQGGAQRQCAWLANALAEEGDIEVRLLHFLDGENLPLVNPEKVEVVRLPTSSLYSLANVTQVARAVRSRRPSVVFSWLHATDVVVGMARPFFPGGTRWVVAERDSNYPRNWRYLLRRRIGRHADAIVANSEKGRHYWLGAGYPGERVHVANNVLSPGIESAPQAARRFDFLYAGRLEVQKNVEVLAEAFCILASRRPDLRFGIVGDGGLRGRILEIIASHGVSGRVILESYDPNIMGLFRSNPTFVNLSRHEGLPNTILENVACGNRIVASRIPEHVAVLGEDYPLYATDYGDPTAVASVLERAAQEDWSRQTLHHAEARLREMSPERVVGQYMSIFRSLGEDA